MTAAVGVPLGTRPGCRLVAYLRHASPILPAVPQPLKRLATPVKPLRGIWLRTVPQPFKRLPTVVRPLRGIWLRVFPQPFPGWLPLSSPYGAFGCAWCSGFAQLMP